ncbi:MAG: ABC transporter ATP-binding protein, partial [Candidatus Omnitrophica bacterium]|nr:ABC transporter ATP-binding protein [Candidatus Omnitrophota bacterium]
MEEDSPAVRISEVDHFYGERQALSEVSFKVQPGEIFGLLGPNGGGKTTLFRIVSTLFAPSSGTIQVFGKNTQTESDEVRQSMGVVFQSFSLDKLLTVEENLTCQGRLYGLAGGDLKGRIVDRLQKVGMLERLKDRVGTLS